MRSRADRWLLLVALPLCGWRWAAGAQGDGDAERVAQAFTRGVSLLTAALDLPPGSVRVLAESASRSQQMNCDEVVFNVQWERHGDVPAGSARARVDLAGPYVSAFFPTLPEPKSKPGLRLPPDRLMSRAALFFQRAAAMAPPVLTPHQDPTDPDWLWFRWQPRVGQADTGDLGGLRIDQRSGLILDFHCFRASLAPAVQPRLTADQASSTAAREMAKLPEFGLTECSRRLVLHQILAPQTGPAWVIGYRSAKYPLPNGRESGHYTIDAVTGAVLTDGGKTTMTRVAVPSELTLARREDPAAHAPTAAAFLALPQVAPEQGVLRPGGVPPGAPAGTLVGFRLGAGPVGFGSLAVDKAAGRVVWFQAVGPTPPVPMTVCAREASRAPALAFAQAQAPEVFAPGGEVATDGDEAISRQGVWLWRFQRVVSGVRVPTRAEVGVRVYDQRVAHYRSEHRPYDPALLGGLLSREALRASVAKRQGDTAQVTLWLDERLELAEVDKQWRPVWQLWYEVRQRAWPATRATLALDQETVDARSGEPIRDRRDPRTTRDMSEELLAFYLARGGQFAARPKPLPAASYTDSAPVFAPDGRRLAFLSNRPREGFPAWLARSNGAFVCDADGRQTVCVDLGPCLGVDFAPDGRQALVVRGDELVTVDLATGARRRVPRTLIEPLSRGGDHRPPGWTQATWPVADRLVALVDAGGQPQLVVVDLAPAQPTVAPMELKADGKPVVGHLTGVGRLPDGRALVAVNQKGPFQRARERFGEVWAVDPRDPAAAPRLLAKELPLVQRLTRGPAGKLLLWDDRTLPERWLLDPATGQVSELPAGVGAEAGRDLRPGLAWSPDGRLTCWSERHWTGQDRDPAAHVLWVGDAQAKGGRPLLAPTADLPQVLGEGK